MLNRLTQYCSALIFLIALAVIYHNALTPWMQPPVVEAVAMKASAKRGVDPSLADLFPDAAWQRGSCKQLQTSQGMMLFEHWEQTSDDHWKLWPITVVIGRGLGGDHDEDPVILEAPEGAELKFTESLDVMSGGAPPIEWGRMIGNVHIYRCDNVPSSDDPTNVSLSGQGNRSRSLDLRTANVGIDNKKIWTTETISMSVGEARMVGRDLTIHLVGGAGRMGGSSSSKSPATLDRMELIYLEELVMPMRGGGLLGAHGVTPTQQPGQLLEAEQAGTVEEDAMISIACGGRVEYDFAIDQLMLRDSVSLVYQSAGAVADRFDCQQLTLTLNDPMNDQISRQSPLDWLVKIVAVGEPAVAKLPSIDTEIKADEINFNALKGLVEANGRRGIRVRRAGITASLASLFYQFNPSNPETIGRLDVNGAGIVEIDIPGNPVRKARWRDSFHAEPNGKTTAKELNANIQLSIAGDIHAWLVDGGEFQADNVDVLLIPEPKLPGQVVNGSQSNAGNTLVPHQVIIAGDVKISTSAIVAETQLMQLVFVNEENPPSELSNDRSVSGENKVMASPLRQWVAQPTANSPLVDPVARARPILRGDSINAQLRRNASGLSAKQLYVEGNVEVEHVIDANGRTLPARLTGQQLALKDGGGEDVLQLSSSVESPARFDMGDGFFIGPQIQIWPSLNTVSINAAGEFRIPTAALPSAVAGSSGGSAPSDGSGSSVVWANPPHCRWQGEMIFDGRKAVLTEGVDITATLISNREPWELGISGDRLEVDLLESVQMRDMSSMRDAVIQNITMLQTDERPVIAQALHRAPDGVLEAKHLIHARTLTLAPSAGGRLVGTGPGWYRGWTVGGSSNPLSPQPDRTLTADATLIDGAARDLTGIHLTFNDSMQADLSTRNLDFLRGVRVGIQNVAGWDQAFDAANMDAISEGQSTLDCDRLRFSVEPSPGRNQFGNSSAFATTGMAKGPTNWEMEATSGVVFRTRTERGLLEGTASRAAYSSSKDVFTVEGSPNRPAIFRQTQPDGQPGPEGAVRSLNIRPRTMTVENAVFERLNIATPPSVPKR